MHSDPKISSIELLILTIKEPTADNGSGNWFQYIASVIKLRQISVDLSMVTSVGF